MKIMKNFNQFIKEDQLQSVDLDALKKGAKQIRHVGDYGALYLNSSNGKVFWMAADSDCDPEGEFSSEEEIKNLLSVDGVSDVEIDYEAYPNEESGFTEISY